MCESKMKILHIISGLGVGGAEKILFTLCSDDSNQHYVVSLSGNKLFYYNKLKKINNNVVILDMSRLSSFLSSVVKLYKLIRVGKFDVIQTWMHHADVIGGICAKLAGHKNIIWNIRNSSLLRSGIKIRTKFFIKLSIILSGYIPNKIIFCSQVAYNDHLNLGYKCKNHKIINNGYDLSRYRIDADNIKNFDREKYDIVIGMVARFDYQKDHLNCLRAIGHAKSFGLKPLLILVGNKCSTDNHELMTWIKGCNLIDNVKLIGYAETNHILYNKFDITILSSRYGEGFPNVIAESMACGVPCISTDVGDAKSIIDDTGWIVPISNSIELAGFIKLAYIELNNANTWNQRRLSCFMRIHSNYSQAKMINEYISYWKS